METETENKVNEGNPFESEGLKLKKNSKGYNWEISIKDVDIQRLAKLADEMETRWGDKKDVI